MWPWKSRGKPPPDERYRVAYDEARRLVSEQQATLDNLQSRVGVLVSVAALVTSFLGDAALAEGRELGLAGIVAVGAFVALLAPALSILLPREWTFKVSPRKVIGTNVEGKHQPLERLWRDLALHLETAYDENDLHLKVRMNRYTWAIGLLGVEVVAWLLELGVYDFVVDVFS